MNLERIFNILCVIAAALIISSFFLIRYEEAIPRWAWDGLTVLIVAAWSGVIAVYIVLKIRKRKEKKESQNKE